MKLTEITQKPTLWMPIAASGSGKTSYLRTLREENPNILSFSWDDLRMEWYDPTSYGNAYRLSQLDEKFAEKAFQNFLDKIATRQDVYVDNTNTTPERRAKYIEAAKAMGYYTVSIEMPVDVEVIVERQQSRGDKKIKESTVREQHAKLQPPKPFEFDENRISYHNLGDK